MEDTLNRGSGTCKGPAVTEAEWIWRTSATAGTQGDTQLETRGVRSGEVIRIILSENDSRPLRVFRKEMTKEFPF